MTRISKSHSIQRNKVYVRKLPDGSVLEAEVSPRVFIYQSYPLQIEFALKRNGDQIRGNATKCDRTLNATTGTEEDVQRLLAGVRTKPCSRCGGLAFDPMTADTNRNGLCEDCFSNDSDRAILEADLRETYKAAKLDRQMRSKGMKYRVTAWIHADDGDDEQVDWFFRVRPKPAKIRGLIRKEGSEVLDDYEIVTLIRTRKPVD